MIPQWYRLNDRQRAALRELAEFNFAAGDSPLRFIHAATLKRLVRMGLVEAEQPVLTRAGLVAVGLIEEIDELQR